jgi:hypothetical protein
MVYRRCLSSSFVVLVQIFTWSPPRAFAAERGFEPFRTWSQWVAQFDSACFVKMIGSSQADRDGKCNAEFEVIEILKAPPRCVKRGDRIRLTAVQRPRELCLIFGLRDPSGSAMQWCYPSEVTQAAFDYISHAPSTRENRQTRLKYFLNFIDSSDSIIGPDVSEEFREATFDDLVALVPSAPRDKLRGMFADHQASTDRLGLAALLLGLGGDVRDAKLLAVKITENGTDFRPGIHQVMAAYLLLAGEAGLDNLDAWKLKNRSASFSETFAAMAALEIVWAHGNGRITRGRLIFSMRLVLDHPELIVEALFDLSRWHDWGSLEQAVRKFNEPVPNSDSRNRAIVRHVLACIQAPPNEASMDQRATAKRCLEQLRKKDRKLLEAEESEFSCWLGALNLKASAHESGRRSN